MKILLTIAAAVALAAAPALAQDHAAHHPTAAAAKPAGSGDITPEKMHEHCAAAMTPKAQATPKHEHSADPAHAEHTAKAPGDAEMKAMHEKCAAMMARHKAHSAPAAK
jgi:hypothetical protein